MTFLLCKHRTWEDVAGQKLFGMCGVGVLSSQFSVLSSQFSVLRRAKIRKLRLSTFQAR
jgi:hypothetical protein